MLKKTSWLLLVCVLLTFANCKRAVATAEDQQTTSLTHADYRNALLKKINVPDINEISLAKISSFKSDFQVTLFNFMDERSKSRIWKEKIAGIKELTTDIAKKNQLLQLENMITPEMFSPTKQGFSNVVDWAKRNESLFGIENIKVILLTLNKVSMNKGTGDYVEEFGDDEKPCPPLCPPTECTCNRANHSSGCSHCLRNNCIGSVVGCGYMGNEACDGGCY